jgi:hypothetical protein
MKGDGLRGDDPAHNPDRNQFFTPIGKLGAHPAGGAHHNQARFQIFTCIGKLAGLARSLRAAKPCLWQVYESWRATGERPQPLPSPGLCEPHHATRLFPANRGYMKVGGVRESSLSLSAAKPSMWHL